MWFLTRSNLVWFCINVGSSILIGASKLQILTCPIFTFFCNGIIRTRIDLKITTLFKQFRQNPILEYKVWENE